MQRPTDDAENAALSTNEIFICPARGCEVEDCPLSRVDERKSRKLRLGARNILTFIAALLFMTAMLVNEKDLLLKAVAYGMGALAYATELVIITGAFKKSVPKDELFMPLLFGALYIFMGFSYALEHHYLG